MCVCGCFQYFRKFVNACRAVTPAVSRKHSVVRVVRKAGLQAIERGHRQAERQKLFSEAGFDPATCGLWAHHSTSEPLRTLRQTASSGMTRIRCFDPAFSACYKAFPHLGPNRLCSLTTPAAGTSCTLMYQRTALHANLRDTRSLKDFLLPALRNFKSAICIWLRPIATLAGPSLDLPSACCTDLRVPAS